MDGSELARSSACAARAAFLGGRLCTLQQLQLSQSVASQPSDREHERRRPRPRRLFLLEDGGGSDDAPLLHLPGTMMICRKSIFERPPLSLPFHHFNILSRS